MWAFHRNTDSSLASSSWGWGKESWDLELPDDVWKERGSRGTGGGLVGGLCKPILEVARILSVHILVVKNKILLDTGLSGCSLDRFGCSRVGAYGLEVLGRINRDTKELQRRRVKLGGQPK